uniref:General transcription factor IIH subunit n=1 Tax=Lynceus sp. MCZ IZ 141354 TaxID=1930659 RepID=A0A9N6ZFY5_9CRUS|nr:EOG090X05VA [Lynceus sp. MCZ IZ 141354]
MADDEDGGKEYRWETGYEKTWEAIEEDEEGLIETNVADLVARSKRRRAALRAAGSVRLGMMRHIFLILDLSECMTLQDLRPTRQLCVAKILEGFIGEFFDQNPISQMGIIVTRNKRAEKVSELAGNPHKHIEAIRKIANSPCGGEPSLQNSLELALQSLKHMPPHTSREVLFLFGSLTTCDPGDISVTVESLKKENIRVSVIGLSAEVRICRHISKETKGEYGVLLDEHHLRELVLGLVEPPVAASAAESSLVRMGFPGGNSEDLENLPALCMCHIDMPESSIKTTGYNCPQCGARYCELPVECKVCGLTLISAPHLARSYHHLFPLAPFQEHEKTNENQRCFACLRVFNEKTKHVYVCSICKQVYCLDCDLYIHDTLHACPGCSSHPDAAKLLTETVGV